MRRSTKHRLGQLANKSRCESLKSNWNLACVLTLGCDNKQPKHYYLPASYQLWNTHNICTAISSTRRCTDTIDAVVTITIVSAQNRPKLNEMQNYLAKSLRERQPIRHTICTQTRPCAKSQPNRNDWNNNLEWILRREWPRHCRINGICFFPCLARMCKVLGLACSTVNSNRNDATPEVKRIIWFAIGKLKWKCDVYFSKWIASGWRGGGTYVHMKRSELCGRIRPIQTVSVTSNSLRKARAASNWTPLSTGREENERKFINSEPNRESF